MIEVKLIPTTLVGKPAIAIVTGAIIQAEPEATRGVHWEKENDIFGIINRQDIDDFTDTISKLNENTVRPLSLEYRGILVNKVRYYRFHHKILEYIKF